MGENTRLQRTAEVLSAVQSFVVTAGIIVGAIWTYHTFSAQLHVENAQAQLKKLHRDLESEPRVEVEFKVIQTIPEGKKRLLIMELVVENKGNKEAYVSFGRQPIRVYRALMSENGDTGLYPLRTALLRATGKTYLGGAKVQPGSTSRTQFLTYVEGPGVYCFEYSTPMSEGLDPKLATAAGAATPVAEQQRWGTMNYFRVQ